MRPETLSIFLTTVLRFQSRAIALSLAGLLAVTACGSKKDKSIDPAPGDHAEHAAYEGDLDKKISEIYGKENEILFDKCDFDKRSKILEIAKALEMKRGELARLTKEKPENSDSNVTPIGKFKFVNPAADAKAEDKWVVDTNNWNEIIEYYEKIKKLPTGKEWLVLNRAARGITSSDEDRLAHGYFLGAKRQDGPKLDQIKIVADACAAEEACLAPKLSEEQKKFLATSGVLKLHVSILENPEATAEDKRKIVLSLKKRIDARIADFGIAAYDKARVEGKTLIIPVDISVFEAGGSAAIELVEKTWNIDPEYKIKLEPTQSVPASIYKVNVSEEPGGRAFVSSSKKIMQLYNFDRLSTISHEFGHILGFPDYYYTYWNNESCSYEVESNPGDMMSDSDTGIVRPTHWDLLKKAYWK